jgi:hypothetical protein
MDGRLMPFEYWVIIREVHDGDTYRGDVDLGFGMWHDLSVRLSGASLLELDMPGGPESAAHVGGILAASPRCYLRSIKAGKVVDPATRMSFNRYVCDVTLSDGRDLATLLVRTGWAVWWDGRSKPTPYPVWPIPPGTPQE